MMMSNNNASLKNNKSKTGSFILDKNSYWLLLFIQLANILLLTSQIVPWMLALIALSLLWRVVLINASIQQPIKWVVNLFALAGCVVLLLSSVRLGVLLSMVHLLCFAYALKQLEIRRRSDIYQLVLIGLFVLAAAMIFNQSLYFSVLIMLITLLNLSILFYFFVPQRNIFIAYKGMVRLMIQSVPLALILFVVFPRIPPFWSVPHANSAKTGLSDKVTPGDIANLINSNELVFRVNFIDNPPSFKELYWRTLILENYDGHSWTQTSQRKQQQQAILAGQQTFTPVITAKVNTQSRLSHYQVIAEPNYQQWLYTLAIPEILDNSNVNAKILKDYTAINQTKITQTLSYQVNSFLNARLDVPLSTSLRLQNLDISNHSNPKLVAEAKRLRSIAKSDKALIDMVLRHIRQQNYRYTLKPPLLDNNSLDQFYFDTKAGFCVHFASSFTYLMRAAGIPARLVTGYMGGEYNYSGNYYSVYQYDAHAWSEVWLPNLGWTRVDPTAAVDPDRVEQGFSNTLLAQRDNDSDHFFSLSTYRDIPWLNFIKQQVAALDYQWTRWVIGYTPEQQFALLNYWMNKYNTWQLWAVVILITSLFILWFWLTSRQKTRQVDHPIWLTIYLKALKLLQDRGVVKGKKQSTAAFARHVKEQNNEAGQLFIELTNNFNFLHYSLVNKITAKKRIRQMKNDFKLFRKKVKNIK